MADQLQWVHRTLMVLLLLSGTALRAQTLSFSFDDGFDPRTQPEAREWNRQILDALSAHNVKAALFPAGKVVDSPEGLALVRQWGEAGHRIGNHTYSHRNFGSPKVSVAEFAADVLAADRLLGSFDGWHRSLRFPYLKEGETEAKRDAMRQWMAAHGYSAAPVSIDTSDWYYNQRFLAWRARHPGVDPPAFRQAYLDHLWDRANYYEGLARKLGARSPAHVMLLHVNAINAAFLADVIQRFRARGWKVAGPDEAFADPLYAHAPKTLPAGESIVWAIAKEAGATGLRYPAEDEVYEKPALDAAGL